MTDDDTPTPRKRDRFDQLVDELFAVINVRFWQLVVIALLLGVALGVALAAAR